MCAATYIGYACVCMCVCMSLGKKAQFCQDVCMHVSAFYTGMCMCIHICLQLSVRAYICVSR